MIRYLAVLAVFVAFASPVWSADANRLNCKRNIQPLLNKYSIRCHGPKKQAGKVNITTFAVAPKPLKDRTHWRKLLAKRMGVGIDRFNTSTGDIRRVKRP